MAEDDDMKALVGKLADVVARLTEDTHAAMERRLEMMENELRIRQEQWRDIEAVFSGPASLLVRLAVLEKDNSALLQWQQHHEKYTYGVWFALLSSLVALGVVFFNR